MKAVQVEATSHEYVTMWAEPDCGEYCDSCGDCLRCYAEDPCGSDPDWSHSWVVYADQIEDFYANHPERLTDDEEPPLVVRPTPDDLDASQTLSGGSR